MANDWFKNPWENNNWDPANSKWPNAVAPKPASKIHTKKEDEPKQVGWINIAAKYLGVKRDTSENSNPQIIEFDKACVPNPGLNNDNDEWCGSFVSFCLKSSSVPFTWTKGIDGYGSFNADYWAKWQEGESISKPAYGAIVTFNWDGVKTNNPKHVAMIAGKTTEGKIQVLGGNQSPGSQVNIHEYESTAFDSVCHSLRMPKGYKIDYDLKPFSH